MMCVRVTQITEGEFGSDEKLKVRMNRKYHRFVFSNCESRKLFSRNHSMALSKNLNPTVYVQSMSKR